MKKCFSGCRVLVEPLDNCVSVEVRSSSVSSHGKLEKSVGSIHLYRDGDKLPSVPGAAFLTEGVNEGEIFYGKTFVFQGVYDPGTGYSVVVWWKGMKIVRPVVIARTK